MREDLDKPKPAFIPDKNQVLIDLRSIVRRGALNVWNKDTLSFLIRSFEHNNIKVEFYGGFKETSSQSIYIIDNDRKKILYVSFLYKKNIKEYLFDFCPSIEDRFLYKGLYNHTKKTLNSILEQIENSDFIYKKVNFGIEREFGPDICGSKLIIEPLSYNKMSNNDWYPMVVLWRLYL